MTHDPVDELSHFNDDELVTVDEVHILTGAELAEMVAVMLRREPLTFLAGEN
ncbi:hypothetical protein ACTFBT_01350 [Streptomyces microflavus]|uniref:Uncharacterized protein n=1 Tax=Streptomyces microflavus TaxID=1919 RepID=A0A7J0D4D2_STRMI|nr:MULTISPECIES: hypothetical protein [Streptomyces]MDX2978127.1 hypothetical protein [Streptomyces sp. NRRL_B-2249]GFN09582.1 hypothetical protein Smic_81380 [Streptomyces microflavus]GGX66983.1 hypothetical protein GCM10010298_34620 [Streptomyces microflavus]